MVGAPKLMRRTKGVMGAVLALAVGRSSSTALSSMESELVERLPRRMAKAGGLVGEVPERPMVVKDKRRLWASVAEAGEKGGPLGLAEGPRWKRLERAAWVMELRRLPVPQPPPGPEGAVLSEDMSTKVESVQCWAQTRRKRAERVVSEGIGKWGLLISEPGQAPKGRRRRMVSGWHESGSIQKGEASRRSTWDI